MECPIGLDKIHCQNCYKQPLDKGKGVRGATPLFEGEMKLMRRLHKASADMSRSEGLVKLVITMFFWAAILVVVLLNSF